MLHITRGVTKCHFTLKISRLAYLQNHQFFKIFNTRAKNFNSIMDEANLALKKGQFDASIELFDKALKLDDPQKPQSQAIIKRKAFAYIMIKQFEKSIECYNQLQGSSQSSETKVAVAFVFGKSGNQEKCYQIFEEEKAHDPNNLELIKQIALYCEHLGNIEKSAFYLTEGLKIQPKNQELIISLGILNIKYSKDYQKALEYLQQAEEVSNNNGDLLYNIGMCHFQLKNYDLSLKYLNNCLQIDPLCQDAKRNIRVIQNLKKE